MLMIFFQLRWVCMLPPCPFLSSSSLWALEVVSGAVRRSKDDRNQRGGKKFPSPHKSLILASLDYWGFLSVCFFAAKARWSSHKELCQLKIFIDKFVFTPNYAFSPLLSVSTGYMRLKYVFACSKRIHYKTESD